MATIAIIGAAGFVGMELVNELAGRGHNVIAIARNNGKFLLQGSKCTVIHPSEVKKRNDIDFVVNLAYPNGGSVHHYHLRNNEILKMIEDLAGDNARIIHTSTVAVFGFQLEYPIAAAPVADRRDYLYVESKIQLENLLQKKFSVSRLDIIRLGNIWGKKSAAWTSPLIDKLLFGYPVGVQDNDGYSNITDVANVVSYISFLIEMKAPSEMLFHHLAEFSGTRWSYWIQKLSSELNTKPLYIPSIPYYPSKFMKEVKDVFAPVKPRVIYTKLVFGRFTGSLMHSLIGILPEDYFASKKQQNIQQLQTRQLHTTNDETFLWVMSCSKQFVTVTEKDWKPAIDLDESWNRVFRWMHDIGYLEEAAV